MNKTCNTSLLFSLWQPQGGASSIKPIDFFLDFFLLQMSFTSKWVHGMDEWPVTKYPEPLSTPTHVPMIWKKQAIADCKAFTSRIYHLSMDVGKLEVCNVSSDHFPLVVLYWGLCYPVIWGLFHKP